MARIPGSMCRASDAAAFSQVRSGSDHADSLYEDTGDNVRAPQEEVCRGEDRDPPEDDDDENGVLAGRVHENRLLVLGYRVIYPFIARGSGSFFLLGVRSRLLIKKIEDITHNSPFHTSKLLSLVRLVKSREILIVAVCFPFRL